MEPNNTKAKYIIQLGEEFHKRHPEMTYEEGMEAIKSGKMVDEVENIINTVRKEMSI